MNERTAALTDPRIPPLVKVLRDGTDDQANAAWEALIDAHGWTLGTELWDQALSEAYPPENQGCES